MRRRLATEGLVAAVLLAMISLCLARVDAATASSLAGSPWEKGVTAPLDEVLLVQEMVAAEERGAVVPERMATEEVSTNDYAESHANGKHSPPYHP